MWKGKSITVANVVMALVLMSSAILPTRPAITAQAASDDVIAYNVQDQQRALLSADLIALCREKPVLCAETRLILETARQVPNLNADAYYQLRNEITMAFQPDRDREEAGHGVWFGPGEMTIAVTEQRGLEALSRLEAGGPNVAPLVPAIANAIAMLTSSDEENVPGVSSSWERNNAQQQETDLAQREVGATGGLAGQVADLTTTLDQAAGMAGQVAALTIDRAAVSSSPYSDVMRTIVIDKLTGPLGYAPGATVGTILTQSKLSIYEPTFAQQYFPGVPVQQSKSAATTKALDLHQIWEQGKEGYQLWREIEGRQKDLGAYAQNPNTAEDQRRAAEQRLRHEKNLNTARTIGNTLASLIDLKDKKLGREVRVTVNAVTDFVGAIDKYNLTKTMIAASTAANWVKLGLNVVAGGIMTAGLIGATMQVVALFKHQSAPADPVLEQLKLLRQEIHQLRQEMHERFDRVDAKLDAIMEKLDLEFDKIDLDLGIIKDDLAAIHRELWDTYSALNRLDSRFYQWVDAGFRRPLLEAINGCLDYQRTHTGGTLPYQGGNTSYVECENVFHAWATIHATDALQAGTVRDADAYRDDRVYDEINNYRPIQGDSYVGGYDASLNYLNNYLATKGWPAAPPFASGVLPNPRDWVTAARAYLALEREWPEYDRQVATSRLDGIYKVGQRLQAALGQLSIDSADGSRDNQRFYGQLVDNYITKANALNDSLPTIINEYKDELRGQQRLSGNVDFWGGSDQDTGYSRTIGSLGRCADGRDYDLAWPSNLWSRVPKYYQLAEQLKLGNIDVVCDAGPVHIDQRTYYNECRWFYSWSKLYITLTVRFQGQPILRWVYVSQEILTHFNAGGHYCFGRPYPNPESFSLYPNDTLLANWSQGFNIRGWMESTPPQVLNPTLDSTVRLALEAKLREHQDAVVRRIRGDLAPGGKYYATMRELAGAKALLDAFVHLGLPRAYQTDELLSALIAGDAGADVCTQVVVDPTTGRTEWRVAAANRVVDEPLLHALLDCAVANSATRPDLRSLMQQRAETLRATIAKHLTLIDDGKYQEGHYAIDATLRALSVRRELKRFVRPGVIAGMAFRDDNRNGRQDSGEPSTADVTIFIDTDGNSQVDQGEWFDDRNGNNWPDDDEAFDDRNYNWRRDAGEHWATTTANGRFTFSTESAGFRSICGVPPTDYVVIGPRCKQVLVAFNASTIVPFGLAPPNRIMLPVILR